MSALATEAIAAIASTLVTPVSQAAVIPMQIGPAGPSFANILDAGLERVNQQLIDADSLVQAFATNDAIPVHQVTIALEQARMSVELMLQVRSRLVDGFQEIMRMQL